MVELKSLIILKEFKKARGKFLRVSAKNIWKLKLVEKIFKSFPKKIVKNALI